MGARGIHHLRATLIEIQMALIQSSTQIPTAIRAIRALGEITALNVLADLLLVGRLVAKGASARTFSRD
jgi:hypothetical protein